MSLPAILNILLCSSIVYFIVVRVNMLQGSKNWTHRISLTSILIGVCWYGYEPILYNTPVFWHDLFLPAGLAIFFFRYVRKVERFFKAGFNQ